LWTGLSKREALLGQKEEALRDARKAVELMPEALDATRGVNASINLAVVYAWTGDKNRAVAEITRLLRPPCGLAPPNVNVHFMRTAPAYAPLRGDPRFEALLKNPKNNEPLF